nr:ABC transporter substrate-binding protein [Nanchangia anserum]
MTRFAAATVVGAFALGGLAACSSGGGDEDKAGSVYILNWKPESEEAFKKITKAYTDETGVKVKLATAASGTYEQTLKSEVAKSEAPTLFQINGPVGLKTWQSYARDLSDTKLAKDLTDPELALKGEDGKTYGLPAAVEGYGIIYNQAIMNKYFALPGAKVKSVDEIHSFATLKEVADDMQAKKSELGIDGVFASTSLASGEDWRWQTHLSNMAIAREFKDEKVTDSKTVKFTYADQFKQIFDLYLTDSTVAKSLTPSKTVSDSMAEFAQGKAAMVQNGNWAWSQIAEVQGNTVKEDDIKFMPIYMGLPDEDKQGIAVGTEAYMAVNAKASEADQKATLDFLDWLFMGKGKQYVTKDLGFNAPYKSFGPNDVPSDPLAKQVHEAIASKDTSTVSWVFQTYPSQDFKDTFGQALAQYAAGNKPWDEVVKTFVDGWKAGKAG